VKLKWTVLPLSRYHTVTVHVDVKFKLQTFGTLAQDVYESFSSKPLLLYLLGEHYRSVKGTFTSPPPASEPVTSVYR
jgi:hypothetical protein